MVEQASTVKCFHGGRNAAAGTLTMDVVASKLTRIQAPSRARAKVHAPVLDPCGTSGALSMSLSIGAASQDCHGEPKPQIGSKQERKTLLMNDLIFDSAAKSMVEVGAVW